MTIEKKMEDRRKTVLRFDRWTCKLCDDIIESPSKTSDDAEKDLVMIEHIKTSHKNSPHVDYGMKEKFLVLYFTPYTGDIVQENEKLL